MLRVSLRSLGSVGVWVPLLLLDLWGLWGGSRVMLWLALGLRGWAWLGLLVVAGLGWLGCQAPWLRACGFPPGVVGCLVWLLMVRSFRCR